MSITATAEEKTNKKNDVKAKSLLLMALPNEHPATKKTQKTLLKQQCVNFSAKCQSLLTLSLNRLSEDIPQVSTASPNVNAASPQVSTASVSDNTMYAFMAAPLLSVRAEVLSRGTGKCRAPRSKESQFRNQDNTRKQGNNEDKSSKAMLAIDGVGFDWSDMVEEQIQTNMALMAFSDSEDNGPKDSSPKDSEQESNVVCDKKSDNSKENTEESLVEEQVSQDTNSFVESSPKVDKENFFSVNKRAVNAAHPKIAVHSAKSKTHFFKQAQSTAKRPFYKQTTLTRRSVHTAKGHYYNGRPRAVTTANLYSGQVNVVKGKPQHDDKGFVDSGCSRRMTGNIAYLSDFKEFDGGMLL
ncbi:hypothetical protein Tco_1173123 [Tanacetum coccineum]